MFGQFEKKFFSIPGFFGAVVSKQIDVYLDLKRRYTASTENDILNMLLTSRIKTYSMLPQSSYGNHLEYYDPLLDDDEKTLDDVIFDIVWYEFIISRQDWVAKHSTSRELRTFEIEVEKYISDQIKQRVAHE